MRLRGEGTNERKSERARKGESDMGRSVCAARVCARVWWWRVGCVDVPALASQQLFLFHEYALQPSRRRQYSAQAPRVFPSASLRPLLSSLAALATRPTWHDGGEQANRVRGSACMQPMFVSVCNMSWNGEGRDFFFSLRCPCLYLASTLQALG